MEPDVHFAGLRLLPRQPLGVNEKANSENSIWTLHITQFALAENPQPGRNTVSLVNEAGESFAVGTLEKDRCEQFQADFMLSEHMKLVNSGDSEVHVTGYKTTTDLLDPDAEELAGDTDDEDFEQELARKAMAKAARRSAAADDDDELDGADDSAMESDEDEDDSEDDEAGDGMPIDETAFRKAIKAELEAEGALPSADNTDDSDEEGEEDDEDEDEGENNDGDDDLLAGGKGPLVSLKRRADKAADSSDDEEQYKEPAKAQRQPNGGEKKVSFQADLQQANKKPKPESQDEKADTVAAGEELWVKELATYIAREGPTRISALGSAVRKPLGMKISKKLKRLLNEHNKLFSIDAEQMVSLAE